MAISFHLYFAHAETSLINVDQIDISLPETRKCQSWKSKYSKLHSQRSSFIFASEDGAERYSGCIRHCQRGFDTGYFIGDEFVVILQAIQPGESFRGLDSPLLLDEPARRFR